MSRGPDASVSIAVATLLAVLGMPLDASAAPNGDHPRPFTFALLGDPQIGYGPGGEYADAARFAEVVADVDRQRPAFVVIPGDLVQDRSVWQDWAFRWELRKLDAPALLVVGNHDVVDQGSLATFRKTYGRDYYDVVHAESAFVVVNSETARDRRISTNEHDAQWRWLESTLAAHQRAARKHIVLIGHRPPYVDSATEEANERNWPLETRARLLSLCRRHGVRWFLAGHLHRTVTTRDPDGLTIAVVAGTSRTFDRSPVGYRLFRVDAEALTDRWVTVAPAPPPPFVVPGFKEWTPRLFAFSARHWVLTLLYVGAGALAFRAGKRYGPSASASLRKGADVWHAIALFLFVLGANMQLDLDEALRDVGRFTAKVTGIEPIRHAITGTGVAVVALTTGTWIVRRWLASSRERFATLALAACAVPATWFVLSAISHHDVRMLFNEGWWDILTLVALATIAVCARKSLASGATQASRANAERA
jgi:Icc-related predicted phosphoesterase